MNLTGELKEKARQLVGGNVTKRRLAKLLAEVEAARAKAPEPTPDAGRMAAAYQAASGGMDIPAHVAMPRSMADSLGIEGVEVDTGEAPEQPAEAPNIDLDVHPDPSPSASPGMRELLATMAAMRQEIAALRQPATDKEKSEAIASGKLPVSPVQAGPVGYTGSASLPQGVWFKSPFGPKIDMRLCNCVHCKPHKFFHYFCVVCRQGPFEYSKVIGGRKIWMAPGSTWGVSHECCSVVCWSRYMEMLGRPPGMELQPVNFGGPEPVGDETKLPEARPGVGSD